ncbi:hypothetical protein [Parenemella sanctibonifatiensis]|uniref:Uncharacterized protein n=1 Tax=Parenemella sanctibonifatiensis TaxID=2016505 RepID=A0A255EHP0_9ACTN|nr:hypothetical protein [Parenemella sanctibonifatiensis]OYN90491.1 hypothetical protein CGZ92_01265 [Parenemella sanctibonifatiensis]
MPNPYAERAAAELQSQGWTEIRTRELGVRTAMLLFLAISPLPLVGGVGMAIGGLVGGITELIWIGLVMALVGAAGLMIGLQIRRRSLRPTGPVWRLDPAGITVAGTGPVPWSDLEPAKQRMERNPYDDGWQLAYGMPLTPAGQQRALALAPAHRRVLNPGVRVTVIGGPQPLQSLRVPTPEGMSDAEFTQVLNSARAHFLGQR